MVTEADPARQCVTMTLPMRPEFERIAGSGQWHGGPIAAVIDTVGDYALVMSIGRPLPTINFRVDYLRPAVNTALTVTARVRRAGQECRRGRCRCDGREGHAASPSAARPIRRTCSTIHPLTLRPPIQDRHHLIAPRPTAA